MVLLQLHRTFNLLCVLLCVVAFVLMVIAKGFRCDSVHTIAGGHGTGAQAERARLTCRAALRLHRLLPTDQLALSLPPRHPKATHLQLAASHLRISCLDLQR